MRVKRSIRLCGAILTVLALCALLATPVQAAVQTPRTPTNARAQTSVNANVYLTDAMLQPMFQGSMSQAMPQMMSSALSSMVSGLPQQDQGWALQMANALLQPSATLVSLKPEAGGLLTTFRISLYQGDPKATTTSVLIGFKVTSSSTVQVTALPSANGGQSLVSGPLTTFTVPLGRLNSIAATPQCGDADLGINLKFPISLGATGTASATTSAGSAATTRLSYTRQEYPAHSAHFSGSTATNSYVELPASSLAQLGASIGTMQVSSSITAQNIRVSVQGSDLITTSDIYWHGLIVGNAVSTMTPGAANGGLVVHVLKTDLQVLGGLLSFPMNSYNQQIQQDLNSELSGALTGTFYVNQASIGLPTLACAASDSLILAGAITLG
jgi:hypothetical protein